MPGNLRIRPCILLISCALAVVAARAQPSPATGDALYHAFGDKAGLERLMDDFVARLRADPRTAAAFASVNQRHLKAQLVDQFCQLSGGPCVLDEPDMKAAHAGLEVRKADFNALVEVLQQSMDAQGVAFGAQNRMLALLAPMHRDIVNMP